MKLKNINYKLFIFYFITDSLPGKILQGKSKFGIFA